MISPRLGSEKPLNEAGRTTSPAEKQLDNFLNLEFWPAEPDYRNDPADTIEWLQQLDHLPPGVDEPAAPSGKTAPPAHARQAVSPSNSQDFEQLMDYNGGDAGNEVSQVVIPWFNCLTQPARPAAWSGSNGHKQARTPLTAVHCTPQAMTGGPVIDFMEASPSAAGQLQHLAPGSGFVPQSGGEFAGMAPAGGPSNAVEAPSGESICLEEPQTCSAKLARQLQACDPGACAAVPASVTVLAGVCSLVCNAHAAGHGARHEAYTLPCRMGAFGTLSCRSVGHAGSIRRGARAAGTGAGSGTGAAAGAEKQLWEESAQMVGAPPPCLAQAPRAA